MIIAEKRRGIVPRLILIFICLSIFVGCSKNTDEAFSAFGEMAEITDVQPKFRCEVIYPVGGSTNMVETARALAQKIKEQTGMDTVAVAGGTGYASESFYVILGRVEDGYTEYWYDGMKKDDYICRVYGNKVALGGVSEEATLRAIEEFESEILPTAENGYFADDGIAFEHKEEYELKEARLNGSLLGDYTLVLTRPEYKNAAENFRRLVSDKSGDYPNIKIGEPQHGKREIVIVCDENISNASIRAYGDDVYLTADGVYGISAGLDKMYKDMFAEPKDGIACLDVSGELIYTYSYGAVRIACVVGVGGERDSQNAGEIVQNIEELSLDVALMCVDGSDLWTIIESNITGSGYDASELLNASRTLCAVYNKRTVELMNAEITDTAGNYKVELDIRIRLDGKCYKMVTLLLKNAEGVSKAIQSLGEPDTVFFVVDSDNVSGIDLNAGGYNTEMNESVSMGDRDRRFGLMVTDKMEDTQKDIDVGQDSDYVFMWADIRLKNYEWSS